MQYVFLQQNETEWRRMSLLISWLKGNINDLQPWWQQWIEQSRENYNDSVANTVYKLDRCCHGNLSYTPIIKRERVWRTEIILTKIEESPKEFHWVMNNKNFIIFQVNCYFKVLLLDVGDVCVCSYYSNIQIEPNVSYNL